MCYNQYNGGGNICLASDTIQAVEKQIDAIANEFEQKKSELSNEYDVVIALTQQQEQQRIATYRQDEQKKLHNQIEQAQQNAQHVKQSDIAKLSELVNNQKDELVAMIVEEVEKVYGSF